MASGGGGGDLEVSTTTAAIEGPLSVELTVVAKARDTPLLLGATDRLAGRDSCCTSLLPFTGDKDETGPGLTPCMQFLRLC